MNELQKYQMFNLIDKLLYYSVPAERFDGKPFPENLPEPYQQENITFFEEGNTKANAQVVPGEVLHDLAKLLAEVDDQ